MQTIYKEIVDSKTGFKIPLLLNGKTIESRYDPETDVKRKIQNLKNDGSFYLIIGLGSGLLVSQLLKENKSASFIVVENSAADIEFLKSFPNAKKIIEIGMDSSLNPQKTAANRVTVCLKEDLEKKLPLLYMPALHGKLNIIEQPNYLSVDSETKDFIKTKINSALQNIMTDFSVQAHFGKIWQRNAMENLSQYKPAGKTDIPTEKTAAILAAGPTLDSFFDKIIPEREKYFVIATDTAFSSAIKNKINPDAVVSIDGQLVSENHFLHIIPGKTIFIFDLCANASAVRKTLKWTDKVLFIESGHPLAKFASLFSVKNESKNKNNIGCFFNLFSGSGTVTITAVDFAIKAGFSKIEIAGADFSYINGKPYAKGTYLDNLYNKNTTRISTSEQAFSKLMYRTELVKQCGNSFTTSVLQSYEKSLEDYLFSSKIVFKKESGVYFLSNENTASQNALSLSAVKEKSPIFGRKQCFSYHDFFEAILSEYESIDFSKINYSVPSGISPLVMSVLPYIAFLRFSNQKMSPQEMVKLALINLLRYNKHYEKI